MSVDKQMEWCLDLLDRMDDTYSNPGDSLSAYSRSNFRPSVRTNHPAADLSPHSLEGNLYTRDLLKRSSGTLPRCPRTGQYRSKLVQDEVNRYDNCIPGGTQGSLSKDLLRHSRTYGEKFLPRTSSPHTAMRITREGDRHRELEDLEYFETEIQKLQSSLKARDVYNDDQLFASDLSSGKSSQLGSGFDTEYNVDPGSGYKKHDRRKYNCDRVTANPRDLLSDYEIHSTSYSNPVHDFYSHKPYLNSSSTISPVVRRTASHPVSSYGLNNSNENKHSTSTNSEVNDVRRSMTDSMAGSRDGYCFTTRIPKSHLQSKQQLLVDDTHPEYIHSRSNSGTPVVRGKNKSARYCTKVTILPERNLRTTPSYKNSDNIALLKSYQLRGRCSVHTPSQFKYGSLLNSAENISKPHVSTSFSSSDVHDCESFSNFSHSSSSVIPKAVVRSISADNEPETSSTDYCTPCQQDISSEVSILNKLRSKYYNDEDYHTADHQTVISPGRVPAKVFHSADETEFESSQLDNLINETMDSVERLIKTRNVRSVDEFSQVCNRKLSLSAHGPIDKLPGEDILANATDSFPKYNVIAEPAEEHYSNLFSTDLPDKYSCVFNELLHKNAKSNVVKRTDQHLDNATDHIDFNKVLKTHLSRDCTDVLNDSMATLDIRLPRSTSSPQLESRHSGVSEISTNTSGMDFSKLNYQDRPTSPESYLYPQDDERTLRIRKTLFHNGSKIDGNVTSMSADSLASGTSISASGFSSSGKHRSILGKSHQKYLGRMSHQGNKGIGGMEFLLENIALKSSTLNSKNDSKFKCSLASDLPTLERSVSGSCYSCYDNIPIRGNIWTTKYTSNSKADPSSFSNNASIFKTGDPINFEKACIQLGEHNTSSDPWLSSRTEHPANTSAEVCGKSSNTSMNGMISDTDVGYENKNDGVTRKMHSDSELPSDGYYRTVRSKDHRLGLDGSAWKSLPKDLSREITSNRCVKHCENSHPGCDEKQNVNNPNKNNRKHPHTIRSDLSVSSSKVKDVVDASDVTTKDRSRAENSLKEAPSVDSIKVGCAPYASRIREQCRKLSNRLSRSTSGGSRSQRSARRELRVQKEDVEAFKATSGFGICPVVTNESDVGGAQTVDVDRATEREPIKEAHRDIDQSQSCAVVTENDPETERSSTLNKGEHSVVESQSNVASTCDEDVDTLALESILAAMDIDKATSRAILSSTKRTSMASKDVPAAPEVDQECPKSNVINSGDSNISIAKLNTNFKASGSMAQVQNISSQDEEQFSESAKAYQTPTSENFDNTVSHTGSASSERNSYADNNLNVNEFDRTRENKGNNRSRIVCTEESSRSLRLINSESDGGVNNNNNNNVLECPESIVKNESDAVSRSLDEQSIRQPAEPKCIVSETLADNTSRSKDNQYSSSSGHRQISTLSRGFSFSDDIEPDPWWTRLDDEDDILLNNSYISDMTAALKTSNKSHSRIIEDIMESLATDNSDGCWNYISSALLESKASDDMELKQCSAVKLHDSSGSGKFKSENMEAVAHGVEKTGNSLITLREMLQQRKKFLSQLETALLARFKKCDDTENEIIESLRQQEDEKLLERFRSFLKQLTTFVSLITQLSARLSAAESCARQLPEDATSEPMKQCNQKRDQLKERYSEAVEAKHGVDRLCRQISASLRKCLNEEQFRVYQTLVRGRHFIKPRLHTITSDMELIDRHLKTLDNLIHSEKSETPS